MCHGVNVYHASRMFHALKWGKEKKFKHMFNIFCCIILCYSILYLFSACLCETNLWMNWCMIECCNISVGGNLLCHCKYTFYVPRKKMHRLESFEDSKEGSNLKVYLVSSMELLLWDLDSKKVLWKLEI